MTKRENIEKLLLDHDKFLGIGNTKMASKQLPHIIRALLDYMEEIDDKLAPLKKDAMETLLETVKSKTVKIPESMAEEAVKPCVPCDVTDSNPEPERKIPFVDVGDMKPEEAKAHIEEVKKEIQSKTIEPEVAQKAIEILKEGEEISEDSSEKVEEKPAPKSKK